MVLMAIDHVRVYSGLPAGGPTAGIFFTRWVTHFSAPGFAFFAGTAAFLFAQSAGAKETARFLVSRGLMLVALEMTVIRWLWTFNFDYAHYWLAGVIWMLGWCMVLLAPLVRLRARTLAIVGIAIILLQPLVGVLANSLPGAAHDSIGWLFQILYTGGSFELGKGGPEFTVLYVIIPWIGVMIAGYAFGAVLTMESAKRDRCCYRIGLGLTAAFLVIGTVQVLTSGAGNDAPILFRLLNQRKYPASPLFLLMTLGPMIALLPAASRAKGRLADALETFGRVPMFYYLLHLLVIHSAAVIVSLVRTGAANPWLFGNHPMRPPQQPDGYTWSLPLLYLVFFAVLPVLYGGCRWYAALKARKTSPWLRYI